MVGRPSRGQVASTARKDTARPSTSKKASKTASKKTSKAAETVAAPAEKVESLKKADLLADIAAKTGMTKKDADAALGAVVDTIKEQVNAGRKVAIGGFGTFVGKQRAARKGRNPQTGEELDIPASVLPGFTAAKAWKDELNGKK